MRIAIALSVIAALALAGCGKAPVTEEAVRPVIAMQVQPGSGDSRDVYAGEVRARYEADVAFRVGGKLVARAVDAGASVKKGQVLARLDPEDARLAANASAGQLAAAESDYTHAKAELARHRELLERKFLSASACDAFRPRRRSSSSAATCPSVGSSAVIAVSASVAMMMER